MVMLLILASLLASWDFNQDNGYTEGYKVWYGPEQNQIIYCIDVGNTNRCVIDSLEFDKIYHVYITAYRHSHYYDAELQSVPSDTINAFTFHFCDVNEDSTVNILDLKKHNSILRDADGYKDVIDYNDDFKNNVLDKLILLWNMGRY